MHRDSGGALHDEPEAGAVVVGTGVTDSVSLTCGAPLHWRSHVSGRSLPAVLHRRLVSLPVLDS